MVVELKEFDKVTDLVKPVEEEINKIRSLLGDYLRKLDENRVKLERLQKVQSSLVKLVGGEIKFATSSQEIELMGLKIIVNPTPEDEIKIYEEIVKDLQERLTVLQRVRKALDPLSEMDVDVGVTVLLRDNIPIKIMLRLK